MGSGEPMTSERLWAIKRTFTRMLNISERGSYSEQFYFAGMEMLAEVERLRAENDELRRIASSLPVQYAAFQQRHGERSGGDEQR